MEALEDKAGEIDEYEKKMLKAVNPGRGSDEY